MVLFSRIKFRKLFNFSHNHASIFFLSFLYHLFDCWMFLLVLIEHYWPILSPWINSLLIQRGWIMDAHECCQNFFIRNNSWIVNNFYHLSMTCLLSFNIRINWIGLVSSRVATLSIEDSSYFLKRSLNTPKASSSNISSPNLLRTWSVREGQENRKGDKENLWIHTVSGQFYYQKIKQKRDALYLFWVIWR